jgi:hypothetical protein
VALRLQRTELDRNIIRLQENLQTGQTNLSSAKLKTLSAEMRSPAIPEKLANRGPSKSSPEVLSFA